MKILIALIISTLSFSVIAEDFSVGERAATWNKLNIKVCWQDQGPIDKEDFSFISNYFLKEYDQPLVKVSDHLKEIIQQKIQSEYTKERTGIHFTGWKSCKDSPQHDVQILANNSPMSTVTGEASIGRLNNLIDNIIFRQNKKGYVYLNLSPGYSLARYTDDLLMTALHEFGHVAGLRHEHIQRDLGHEENCRETDESRYITTSSFSTYDPSSIMNYCFMEFIEHEAGSKFYVLKKGVNREIGPNLYTKILTHKRVQQFSDKTIFSIRSVSDELLEYSLKVGLSKGDVHGLKCMYVYGLVDVYKKCHENFRP